MRRNTDLLVERPAPRPPLVQRLKIPRTGVAILSCMDTRLNVFAIFGLAEGDPT